MAKRKRKHKSAKGGSPATKAAAVDAGTGTSTEARLQAAESAIAAHIASGQTKTAVEVAKELHKQEGSAASEALLGQAYAARVQSLADKGMGEEARALVDMVKARYPIAAQAFEGIASEILAKTGALDVLLQSLLAAGQNPEERHRLEDAIRRNLVSLEDLAKSEVLPLEHPLRRGACAAWAAFQAVTSGPVGDEVIALPEISRRSPLAPWKTAIRAIAHFYRREDEACRQCLAAIDPETPPARLAPVLVAMLNPAAPPPRGSRVQLLIKRVAGQQAELRRVFEKAAQALEKERYYLNNPIAMDALRRVCKAVSTLEPGTAERVRRHLWLMGFQEDFDWESLDAAITPIVRRDTAFWALFIHALRANFCPEEDNPYAICMAYDEFLSQAMQEGILEPGSKDVTVIYEGMLKLLNQVDLEDLVYHRKSFVGSPVSNAMIYRGQPADILRGASTALAKGAAEAYFLYPEKIYARIEQINPTAAMYRAWFAYCQSLDNAKACEEVAKRWADAFPRDAEPRLHIMELAEKRKAFKKAMSWLEQAEAVDGLNPRVRRARLRLLLGAFERHAAQGKLHLAAADLDAIEALPPLDGQDRRAVYAALHVAYCIFAGDEAEAARHQAVAAEVLGDTLAAEALCWGIAEHMGVPPRRLPAVTRPSVRLGRGARAAAAAWAAALAKEAGLTIDIPSVWVSTLRKDLRDHAEGIELAHLRALAEALIAMERNELVYYATRPGLLRDTPFFPRFLLLRAKCLPEELPWRQRQCLVAAIELARRHRDFGVLDEAVNLVNSEHRLLPRFPVAPGYQMDAEHLELFLANERREKKLPKPARRWGASEKHYYKKCRCQMCEAGREMSSFFSSSRSGLSDWDDDDDDIFGDNDGFDPEGDLPPELAEIMNKAIEEDLLPLIERLGRSGKTPEEIDNAVLEALAEAMAKQAMSGKHAKTGRKGGFFEDLPE